MRTVRTTLISALLVAWGFGYAPAQDDKEAEQLKSKVQSLIEKLDADEVRTREDAEQALVEIGRQAKRLVEKALKRTKDPEVKLRLKKVLGVYELQELLGDELGKEFLRSAGSRAKLAAVFKSALAKKPLEKQSGEKLAQRLLDAAQTEEEIEELAELIVEHEIKACSWVLVKLLSHEEEELRAKATWWLATMGAKEHVAQIAKALKDKSFMVRRSAASSLGELRAKEHAPRVAKLLKDKKAIVRAEALTALGQLGAKEYVEQIAKFLTSKDEIVRSSAITSLAFLHAKGRAKEIARGLNDPSPEVRKAAVFALAELGLQEYEEEIAALLKDTDIYVKVLACEALARLGAKDKASAIAGLLESTDLEVQWHSARALGKLGSPEALPALRRALEVRKNQTTQELIREAITAIEARKARD